MVGSDDRADSTGCTFAPVLAMYVTSSPLRKASLSVLEEPDTPSHDVARLRGATVPRPRRTRAAPASAPMTRPGRGAAPRPGIGGAASVLHRLTSQYAEVHPNDHSRCRPTAGSRHDGPARRRAAT